MGSSSNKAMTPSLGGVSSAQSTTGRSYRRGGSRTQPTTPTQPTSNTSYRSYRRGGSRTQPTAPTQPTQPTQPTTPTQPPKSVLEATDGMWREQKIRGRTFYRPTPIDPRKYTSQSSTAKEGYELIRTQKKNRGRSRITEYVYGATDEMQKKIDAAYEKRNATNPRNNKNILG